MAEYVILGSEPNYVLLASAGGAWNCDPGFPLHQKRTQQSADYQPAGIAPGSGTPMQSTLPYVLGCSRNQPQKCVIILLLVLYFIVPLTA